MDQRKCGTRQLPCKPIVVSSHTVNPAGHDKAEQSPNDAKRVVELEDRVKELEEQITALRVTERIHGSIIETAQDCVFCKDMQRRYTLINPAMARLMGKPASELLGRTPEQLFGADSAATIREVDEQAMSGSLVDKVETIMVGDDKRTFHTVQCPFQNGRGEVAGVCGIVRDVTDQQRAQEEVARSRALLASLIDSLACDVFALDKNERYILLNKHSQHWSCLGLRPEEFCPDPKALKLWKSNNARALAGETVCEEVEDLLGPKGAWICNIVSPIRRDGEIEGIVGINFNITARKQAEQKLAEHQKHLEALVEKRTQKLKAAAKQLEEQMHEIRRMEREVAAISASERERFGCALHDQLGQQLAGIRYLASALAKRLRKLDSPDSEDAARIAELCQDALKQTSGLAREMFPMDVVAEGLPTALERLALDTRALFPVECKLQQPVAALALDRTIETEVYLIAQEAVQNAVRHADCQHIAIGLETADTGGCLTIQDDGKGVPSDRGKHAGLGLRIMAYRAGLVGGEFDVSSSGSGTTITCTFPLAASEYE